VAAVSHLGFVMRVLEPPTKGISSTIDSRNYISRTAEARFANFGVLVEHIMCYPYFSQFCTKFTIANKQAEVGLNVQQMTQISGM